MPDTPRIRRNRRIVDAISSVGSLASVIGVILLAGAGLVEEHGVTKVILPVVAAGLATVLKLLNRER